MKRLSLVLLLLLLLLRPVHADLVCDGVDDRIVTATITGAPTNYPFTVTAIMKSPGYPGDPYIFQAGLGADGYRVMIRGNLISMVNGATSLQPFSLVTPVNNAWYFAAWSHAAATDHRFYIWDYGTRTAMVDAAVTTNAGAMTAPTSSVKICASESTAGSFLAVFAGTVRQVAVYDKAWTANADAFKAMAYGGPLALATPRLLYNFQSVSGTTVREQQGTGNNGTLANFPATPWVPMNYPQPLWIQ